MNRIVLPELLDDLPPNDPEAIHSRRDLRRINWWMGNVRHIAQAISRFGPNPPARIADLGAGDGSFADQLSRRLEPGPVEWLLIDRELSASEKRSATKTIQWRPLCSDVFDALEQIDPVDVCYCNLFLHHFQGEALARLLALIHRKSRLFIACEPRRTRPSLFATKLLWVLGCNRVTLHDARISVGAGFAPGELKTAWPKPSTVLHDASAGYASHIFVARGS